MIPDKIESRRLAELSRSRTRPLFYPTNGAWDKMEPVEALRKVTIYGMPGFVLHPSVGSLSRAELLTCSHIATGSALAHGTTPITTLRAVRDKIRRVASDKQISPKEALLIQINKMEHRLRTEPGPGSTR